LSGRGLAVKTLFRQLENFRLTQTRTTATMEFRRSFVASKASRQIRPAAAFSYLLRAALCPRVITFRGSLTPNYYSTVVVNFPRNKRRRPLRRWCRREAQYRVAAEWRYQSYDFHSAQRPSLFIGLP